MTAYGDGAYGDGGYGGFVGVTEGYGSGAYGDGPYGGAQQSSPGGGQGPIDSYRHPFDIHQRENDDDEAAVALVLALI